MKKAVTQYGPSVDYDSLKDTLMKTSIVEQYLSTIQNHSTTTCPMTVKFRFSLELFAGPVGQEETRITWRPSDQG